MDVTQITELEYLGKDPGSGTGGCPSASRVVRGPAGYVTVGKRTGPEVAGLIPENIAADELPSFLPDGVAELIARDWLSRHGRQV